MMFSLKNCGFEFTSSFSLVLQMHWLTKWTKNSIAKLFYIWNKLILCHWSLSIPPKSIIKPLVLRSRICQLCWWNFIREKFWNRKDEIFICFKENLFKVNDDEFFKISKNTFSYRTPLVAASENIDINIDNTLNVSYFCKKTSRKKTWS